MSAEPSSAELFGERTREGADGRYVLDFQEIGRTQVAVVGGKGAHLGELSRIEGVRVPAGVCVTTDAFRRIMAEAPSIYERLDRRSRLAPGVGTEFLLTLPIVPGAEAAAPAGGTAA